MGDWFTSFEDAWTSFLARAEPLESFFDEFPDDPTFVAQGWLIVPPPDFKREVLRVQAELEDVPGLTVVPHHFLHVWLRGERGADIGEIAHGGVFDVRCPRVTCFHTAVVAEVESERLASVEAPATFLPHISLAYVERPLEPEPVRAVVTALRERSLGEFTVDELVGVRVPASRTTVLEPWTVVERLPLRR